VWTIASTTGNKTQTIVVNSIYSQKGVETIRCHCKCVKKEKNSEGDERTKCQVKSVLIEKRGKVDKTRRRVREMTDPCAFEVDCSLSHVSRLIARKLTKSPSMPCSCIAATFSSVNPRAYTKKKASAVLRVSRSFISIAMTKRMKRMTKLIHSESSTF